VDQRGTVPYERYEDEHEVTPLVATPPPDGNAGRKMVMPTEDYSLNHDGGKFAPVLATVATWPARAMLRWTLEALYSSASILTIVLIVTIRRHAQLP